MTQLGLVRLWPLLALFLVAVIAAGSLRLFDFLGRDSGIEITLEPPEPAGYQLYIDGAVANPGRYPVRDGDRNIIQVEAKSIC